MEKLEGGTENIPEASLLIRAPEMNDLCAPENNVALLSYIIQRSRRREKGDTIRTGKKPKSLVHLHIDKN